MQGQYDWFSIIFLVNHLRYDNKFEFVVSQVVYVARNPKDVIVSYFHHHKLLAVQDFTADIEKFADYFMKDECKMKYRLTITTLVYLSAAIVILKNVDLFLAAIEDCNFQILVQL